MKLAYNNVIRDIIFVLIILCVSYIFYTPDEIIELPKGIHQWKQSMQFAITKNYAYDNNDFFHPSIDGFFNPQSNSGNLVQEFPLLHYIASFFFKQYPYSLKVLNILILFTGMFFTYKLLFYYLNEFFSVLFISLNLLFIPIVFYYGFSYITDVSALFFGIMSIYFHEKFLIKDKKLYMYVSFILFTLCGLLRLPVVLFPVAYFFIQFLKRFRWNFTILWGLSLSVIGLWYVYVMMYNDYYISTPEELFYFTLDSKQKENVISSLKNFILYQMGYSNSNLLYHVFAIALIISHRDIIPEKLKGFFLLGTLFSIIYFLLWFGIFDAHDYYLIPIIPFFVFLMTILSYIMHSINPMFNYLTLGIITLLNFSYSLDNIRWRFFQPLPKLSLNLMTKYEEGMHWYFKFDDERKWKPIRYISPFNHQNDILRKNGIQINDTAFCIFDETPTYVLSLLGLKGWTAYSNPYFKKFELDLSLIKAKISEGLKYLIVYGNTPITPDPSMDTLLRKKLVLQIDSIYIYNVQHLDLSH